MCKDLTAKLMDFVILHEIHPDPFFRPYDSAVYAVIDCIFSSQAKYKSVENALVRLGQRLPDHPELQLSQFIADVQSLGVERYASEVLTRQVISKRPKMVISCEVAEYLIRHDIEILSDFRKLRPDQAETLILTDLVSSIKGVGPVLARYLLILLGREDHVKPDTLLSRLLKDIGGEGHDYGHDDIRQAVSRVALERGTTPARLDNALWKFESTGRKPLVWQKRA